MLASVNRILNENRENCSYHCVPYVGLNCPVELFAIIDSIDCIDNTLLLAVKDNSAQERNLTVIQGVPKLPAMEGFPWPLKYGGGMDWPPYSPDLNPCDFFLWGYLKDRVYRGNPQTIDALKEAITSEIQAIEPSTLHNVIQGFESRLHAVIELDGAHIEPYLH